MAKRKTSIMQRITIMSWLVAVLSVAVFALIMIRYQKLNIHSELNLRGRNIALNLEEDLLDSVSEKYMPTIQDRCLRVLDGNKDVAFIVVEFDNQYSLVHYRLTEQLRLLGPIALQRNWMGQEAGGQPRPTQPSLEGIPLPESLIYSHTLTQDNQLLGHLHFGMSLDEVANSVTRIYTTAGVVGSLILIGGVVGSWFFAKNITRPIQSLQAFAYKVATGALNARASVDSGDEIGDLAHSINRMVEALEGNQQKLRDSVKTEAAAREKEILLREIHHRVKNNMQILTSLLRLQARRANSTQLRTVLQESESRIRSMGLLHEKLYQSESVSTIDMNGYLRSLTNELIRVNTPAGKKREVRLNVNSIHLGMDTALPCGLIVTELVSNALKYAFPDHPEGIIYVSISQEQTGEYSLVVWDNGIGIPPGVDITKTESLGMRLVTMLTDQLNGKSTHANNQGTRWEIKFQESQYQIRL